MSALTVNSSVSIPDDVIFRELDGEAIILNLDSGVYFGLDAIGTRIWMLVAEAPSIARVIDVMSAEYEVDRRELTRDVLELLSSLADRRLIRVADNASAF